uniref:YIP1 family protein n=1 Tax=Geoglobus ahangari TaxID=113653 RepID=A0A7C3UGX1_9EURY
MIDVLFNPDKFFRERKDISLWICTTIIALNGVVGAYIAFKTLETAEVPSDMKEFFEMIRVSVALSAFLFVFIGWAIYTALIHGISSLLGGEGNFVRSLKIISLGYLPPLILSPIIYYFSSSPLSIESIILGIAVNLWQITIWSFGIHRWRNLELKRAVASCGIVVALSYTAPLFLLMTTLPLIFLYPKS